MTTMRLPYSPDPAGLARMSTAEVRGRFLLENLFELGRIALVHSDVDRASIGGAVPGPAPLVLEAPPEFGSEYFAERRELGVFNIGGPGIVLVNGTVFELGSRDALYIGRGSKTIRFESEDGSRPAIFYFVSYPAHAGFKTRCVRAREAESSALGTAAAASRRTIRTYISPDSVETCQLTMGLTELEEGCVWNTMPAHRHARRSEIYLYLDLPADAVVFHFLGEPGETRHVLVRNRQAVISPPWSIHSGAGTTCYSFIWAMGGENRQFSDMQAISMEELA